MPSGRPRRLLRSPITSPTCVLGHGQRDEHDRLEQHRVGELERLLHRLRAGELEGDLGGVDGVVGAVEQPHAHALDGVAGEHARLHRLTHALLDGGDERAGDDAALDVVDELEAVACAWPFSGSISMWQSPNCPRPPDCFLWRPCAAAAARIVSR